MFSNTSAVVDQVDSIYVDIIDIVYMQEKILETHQIINLRQLTTLKEFPSPECWICCALPDIGPY